MRDPERPLGRLARNGGGLTRLVSQSLWYLHYEGPQCVFIGDDHSVYLVPTGTVAAERFCSNRPDWFVGSYRVERGTDVRARLLVDIREQIDGLEAKARAA